MHVYAKKGPDSDIELLKLGPKHITWRCLGCILHRKRKDRRFDFISEVYNHLEDHVVERHKVPDACVVAIVEELEADLAIRRVN